MPTSLIFAAALIAQPFLNSATVMIAPPLTVPAPSLPSGDVGFNDIMAGRPLAAIRRIEGSDLARAGDPLALINLGTAYKMIGRKDDAARLYRTAAGSDERYDVQLADGRWIDSRRAANLAMSGLDRDAVLALR